MPFLWPRTGSAAAAAAAGLPRPFGTLVSDVIDGTPAAQAGIRKGDIILQFDGVVVEDDTHLINAVKLTEIDRQVAVVVLRDRQPLTLQLRLAELADE